jgi:predicted  nucleic acid-binding Zn-ribbon protein
LHLLIGGNITANISEKVKKIEELNKRLNEMGNKKTDERARIEEEIKKVDKGIDELVYKLYGITEEEKKIIEGR